MTKLSPSSIVIYNMYSFLSLPCVHRYCASKNALANNPITRSTQMVSFEHFSSAMTETSEWFESQPLAVQKSILSK